MMGPSDATARDRLIADVRAGIVPPATRACAVTMPGHAMNLTGAKLALAEVAAHPDRVRRVRVRGVDGSRVTLTVIAPDGTRHSTGSGTLEVHCHDADVLAASAPRGRVCTLVPAQHVLLVPARWWRGGTVHLSDLGDLSAHNVALDGHGFVPCPRSERLEARTARSWRWWIRRTGRVLVRLIRGRGGGRTGGGATAPPRR